MSSGKFKDTWFIVVLVVIAAIFAVLAFSKEKTLAPSSVARDVPALDKVATVAAPAEPVAVEKKEEPSAIQATPTVSAAPVGIKAEHPAADIKKIPAKKPAPSVVMPPKEVVSKDAFAVQVYSFKEKARAEAALRALKDKNYTAYIMVSDLGERGIWYRVRVGTFTSEADALKALESITKNFKSGIIVTE